MRGTGQVSVCACYLLGPLVVVGRGIRTVAVSVRADRDRGLVGIRQQPDGAVQSGVIADSPGEWNGVEVDLVQNVSASLAGS